MKKIFTLAAAATMVLAAQAGTRVLYFQDFESVASPQEAGWSFGGESMEIASDEFGKFLQLNQGAVNGRSGECVWGADIFGENAAVLEDGIYNLSFIYCPKQSSNNQYNSGITVMSNCRVAANQPFGGRWTNAPAEGERPDGYLFDLMQVQRETEDVNSIQFKVNNYDDELIILNSTSWYTISLEVNINERTVAYAIDALDGTAVTEGVRTVPATDFDGTEISMFAEGLYVMVARYQTIFQFDEIKVTCESSADVANTPSVALTRVGQNDDGQLELTNRQFTINFIDGETLNIKGTDGSTIAVEYFDCEGIYKYTTNTSGTLEVWTTCGTAKSEVVTMEVDCTPIVLPAATATVMSVVNGYGKTYMLTVDNSTVPLSPKVFITYKFVGANGEIVEGDEESSGVKFNVTEAGTLTVTTKAFGYQETTITIENNSQYTEKYVVDFARMTADDIKGCGFTADEDLNSANTSGEQNWTARKRMFYYDINTAHPDPETGETIYDAVYPFGFVAEDSENVLHRWIIPADELTEELAASLFPHLTIWNGLQAKMLQGIGLIQDATSNNYNIVRINDLGGDDIVVTNTIGSYGADSCHPVCATADEYFAQVSGTDTAFPVATTSQIVDDSLKSAACYVAANEDGTFTLVFKLYRIDTALTKVTVFSAGEGGIQGVNADRVINTDDAYYTIDGLRLDAPIRSGLYIHHGKKVYITK